MCSNSYTWFETEIDKDLLVRDNCACVGEAGWAWEQGRKTTVTKINSKNAFVDISHPDYQNEVATPGPSGLL